MKINYDLKKLALKEFLDEKLKVYNNKYVKYLVRKNMLLNKHEWSEKKLTIEDLAEVEGD